MSSIYENSKHSSNMSEFTDDEIREQLECLGFKNVSKEKFTQFKTDLEKLITQEVSINTTNSEFYQPVVNNRRANSASPSRLDQLHDRLNRNNLKKVTFPNDSQLAEDNEAEADNDSDQSFTSIVTTSSIVDNKVFKRKIIRKSSSKDVANLLKNPNNMRIPKKLAELHENQLETNLVMSEHEFDDEFNLNENEEQLLKLNECYPPINYPIKSFIRSQSSLSLRSDMSTRSSSNKSNPVQRFHEYSKLWNSKKCPGKKSIAI